MQTATTAAREVSPVAKVTPLDSKWGEYGSTFTYLATCADGSTFEVRFTVWQGPEQTNDIYHCALMEARQANGELVPACEECKGTDVVLLDCTAYYDRETRQWELSSDGGTAHCHNCEIDVELEWVMP